MNGKRDQMRGTASRTRISNAEPCSPLKKQRRPKTDAHARRSDDRRPADRTPSATKAETRREGRTPEGHTPPTALQRDPLKTPRRHQPKQADDAQAQILPMKP